MLTTYEKEESIINKSNTKYVASKKMNSIREKSNDGYIYYYDNSGNPLDEGAFVSELTSYSSTMISGESISVIYNSELINYGHSIIKDDVSVPPVESDIVVFASTDQHAVITYAAGYAAANGCPVTVFRQDIAIAGQVITIWFVDAPC